MQASIMLGGITLILIISSISATGQSLHEPAKGVWNNFNFSRAAEDWSEAARSFGGEGALVDLVVARCNHDGSTELPFPYQDSGYLRSYSDVDRVEAYLQEFDRDGLKVILSIQPGKADLLQLMDLLLSRYTHHQSIIGINVDLEWKQTGKPNYASNLERDLWLKTIKRHNPNLKLFLTYFGDYAHFPDDTRDLVVLFDGEGDAQSAILKAYKDLAQHFKSVGIYTGYSSSHPQAASDKRILSTAPKTEYIIHTDDVFPTEKVLIFLMSDVQGGWLETSSIDLINLHQEKATPVTLAVIAETLGSSNWKEGSFSGLLQELVLSNSDLFDLAQYAYLDDDAVGMSYADQNRSISSGLRIFSEMGLRPATLLPSLILADRTTVKVAEDLGFSGMISESQNLQSNELRVLDSLIFLTEIDAGSSKLKSASQLMAEIDSMKQGVLIVYYEIQNFSPDSGNSIQDLGEIMKALKESRKYRSMTMSQYLALPSERANEARAEGLSGFSLLLGALALFVIWRYTSS